MTKNDGTLEALRSLITESIRANPVELDGFQWAAHPQEELCRKLGISVSTLYRRVKAPPFVSKRRLIDGKMTALIREGLPGPQTHYDLAQIMSAIWRKKFGKANTKKEFGCLKGLAEVWPEGQQVQIFKTVLNDWSAFMAGAKIEMQLLGDEGRPLYYEFPSLTVLRRFPEVAVELHQMTQQAKGKATAVADTPF